MRAPRIAGFLLVALSAFCFGIMPILARAAFASGAGTSTLLFLRFLIGGLAMLGLMRVKRLTFPGMKTMLLYSAMGALGYAGQSFSYFTALNYASASLVSLILYVYPALVTMISVLFLREKLTPKKIIALALALGGCAMILGLDGSGDPRGMLLALAAAAIYSVYIVGGSRIIKGGMAIQSSAVIMLSAALVFGVSVAAGGFEPPRSAAGIAAILAIALISTVAAIWSFFSGLERIGPTNTSLVSTLEPVVTVAGSFLFLGERLSPANGVGGVLILAALVITALPGRKGDKT
jgi:drug/metabolite transporter (DMT)-like permease